MTDKSRYLNRFPAAQSKYWGYCVKHLRLFLWLVSLAFDREVL